MTNLAFVAQKMGALLKLNRQIVGVKIAYSREEYDSFEAKELIAPLEYCVAVKCAGAGHSLKFTRQHSACAGSTRALGLAKPEISYYDGSNACGLGLFKNQETAARVSGQLKICLKPAYGVIIKPLEQFESKPDVVIIIAKPRELMRLIQGYTCAFGLQPNMNLTGNQAVCIECTSYPFTTKEMNISLFCSGTRYLAQWDENEAGAGIPYEKFEATVQGVWDTVNATEQDERKAEIKRELERLGCDCSSITYGDAYYLKIQRDRKERIMKLCGDHKEHAECLLPCHDNAVSKASE